MNKGNGIGSEDVRAGSGGNRYEDLSMGWAERAERWPALRPREAPSGAQFDCALLQDREGRITGKVETVGGVPRYWEYAYDPQRRLTRARLDGETVEQYAYDGEGRRTQSACRFNGGTLRPYLYDARDRLLAMGDARFAYDERGRLAGRTERGWTTRYQYDASGVLVRAALPGGGELAYMRDESGLPRLTLLDGAPQEEWDWLDGLRLGSWHDVPGKRLLEFQYRESQRIPCAVTVHEGGYSYTCALGADQVGTIKTVVDSTGYLIQERQYDSFGNLLRDTNPSFFLPQGFAGGILDRRTGLVRFGRRDYMPEIGRFTAPDPARWTGGDPDLYDYCVDDPIHLIDPLGLFSFKALPTMLGDAIKKAKNFFGFADKAGEAVSDARDMQETWGKGVDMINESPDAALDFIWDAQQKQLGIIKNKLPSLVKEGSKIVHK